ncbi:MAG: leucine-rich repeat protein, partial [Dysgonamonadaceae bacterium]|nr:leucine-rich repeat protein [Dysgonamonadaceae bacterium]
LTEITVPESVTSIGNNVFNGCTGLTSFTNLNPTPQSIISNVFQNIDLTKVTLYVPAESMEAYKAAEVWTNFGNILSKTGPLAWGISDGTLTVSGEGAMPDYSWNSAPWYSYRSSITTVVIGDGVTSIGDNAFYDCSKLTSVTIGNSVISIGYRAFYYCSELTSVTISNSVTSIGEQAFYDCSKLTSVTIGNSVTSIGDWAFRGCSELTSVTIPSSVTSISGNPFYDCIALTAIDVSEDNTAYASENGILFNKEKSALIRYPAAKQDASYTIPSSVTSIGDGAFERCSNLTSVTIPNSVTSIGDYAFAYCTGLASVTNRNPAPQSINSDVFQNVDLINATLYVPASSIEDYEAAAVWTNFGNIVSALPIFHVSVTANNPSMGTVAGTGDYEENSTATISATANPGYRFVKWDDDDTQNPRTITVTQDTTCTAIFEAITYHVTVTANNTSMGTVDGTGDYEENSTVTISATANPGYRFVKWDDDDTQNPRTITVTQDTTYTAIFDVNTNIQQTSDNGISIYPNPVTESFRINGITAPTEVIITDLSGRIVLQQTTEGGEYVAAGNLPNGVYLVRVNGKTLKVVKK